LGLMSFRWQKDLTVLDERLRWSAMAAYVAPLSRILWMMLFSSSVTG
jgi:hypothetical protein